MKYKPEAGAVFVIGFSGLLVKAITYYIVLHFVVKFW